MGGSCQVHSKESTEKGSVKPAWMSQEGSREKAMIFPLGVVRVFSDRWVRPRKPETCNSLPMENSKVVWSMPEMRLQKQTETEWIKKSARVPCLDVGLYFVGLNNTCSKTLDMYFFLNVYYNQMYGIRSILLCIPFIHW